MKDLESILETKHRLCFSKAKVGMKVKVLNWTHKNGKPVRGIIAPNEGPWVFVKVKGIKRAKRCDPTLMIRDK